MVDSKRSMGTDKEDLGSGFTMNGHSKAIRYNYCTNPTRLDLSPRLRRQNLAWERKMCFMYVLTCFFCTGNVHRISSIKHQEKVKNVSFYYNK